MQLLLCVIAIVEFVLLVGLGSWRSRKHYDGAMVVTETNDKKTFTLEIETDPDKLDRKSQIVLQVKMFSEEDPRE